MKITVLIRKQRPNEASPGTFKAFVVGPNEQPMGKNLLAGHTVSNKDTAISIADGKILGAFQGEKVLPVDAPEIDYRIDEGGSAGASTDPVKA